VLKFPLKTATAIFVVFTLLTLLPISAVGQQINLDRIEMMPNQPSPYLMLDWKAMTAGYDSLVYDLDLVGEYLPLIWIDDIGANYPDHSNFGLDVVVGTPRFHAGEAINVLPSVIGASLVGIDKSNQNGENWVLMCEDFFNRRPAENIYLNNLIGSSGNDWWYDTMPNIFFYQLYDLYPNTGDFEYQFTTVADQWLSAVNAMGASSTPWEIPYMNYRAWSFSSMTPLESTPREPEAAGAIAWLLYNAYLETDEEKYRIGAEHCLEFLDEWASNPSYELQLPYGVYTAARMNAELGTDYDVEKFVNWCFDRTNLRNWGALTCSAGGYDLHGLIGEIAGNDYAFMMNGYETLGALAPMVRYDDRFTRAIGKWALNLANASRLFYPNYLPDINQDSEEWSHEYDPQSYIGHEAIREEANGQSPYATGDAIIGGWGDTNLALYGSSHVGIMGGIIDTTDVPMILKLDLTKTNYFSDLSYDTYLIYNSYDIQRSVTIDIGEDNFDIYDSVTNSYLLQNVSGNTTISIPGDQAVQIVLIPVGMTITYDLHKMLAGDIVVDYLSSNGVTNHPPRVKSLTPDHTPASLEEEITIFCSAEDIDEDEISYSWQTNGGSITGSGESIFWTSPDETGFFEIRCIVEDSGGLSDTSFISLEVIDNFPPVINSITADPEFIDGGETSIISCEAIDPDNDDLEYTWQIPAGVLIGTGSEVSWESPFVNGSYEIMCRVEDGRGGSTEGYVNVGVGGMVAYYPFSDNADDESGYMNHGNVNGPSSVPDQSGNANSAYQFDGMDDYIQVPVNSSLNFQDEISINFWFNPSEMGENESFLISHGSWQNRWKVSIIPEQRMRWTLKTDTGIYDLDSETIISANRYYNATVTYGNGEMQLYMDAELESEVECSGQIMQSDIDLTIGQMLPGNNQYNFAGTVDEVRVYRYLLTADEITELYEFANIHGNNDDMALPTEFGLSGNFPNPFNSMTVINYQLPSHSLVKIEIFNIMGQKVDVLLSRKVDAGYHSIGWNAAEQSSGIYFIKMTTPVFVKTEKAILIK
jgi:Concanavalin A-like lectin/glucanases superfamily/Secretion system C-terminal sorting domain